MLFRLLLGIYVQASLCYLLHLSKNHTCCHEPYWMEMETGKCNISLCTGSLIQVINSLRRNGVRNWAEKLQSKSTDSHTVTNIRGLPKTGEVCTETTVSSKKRHRQHEQVRRQNRKPPADATIRRQVRDFWSLKQSGLVSTRRGGNRWLGWTGFTGYMKRCPGLCKTNRINNRWMKLQCEDECF